MRRHRGIKAGLLLLVAVVAAASLLAVPAPALAKGPTEIVVSGPGIPARALTYTRNPDDVDLDSLMSASHLLGILSPGELESTPPVAMGELGPRYRLTWRAGPGVIGTSHAYPFAAGGPIVHFPEGTSFFGRRASGGWWRATPRLRRELVRLGARNPSATTVMLAFDGALLAIVGAVADARARVAGSYSRTTRLTGWTPRPS